MTDSPVYNRIKGEKENKDMKVRTKKVAQVKRKCFGYNANSTVTKKVKGQESANPSSSEANKDDVSMPDLIDSYDVDYCEPPIRIQKLCEIHLGSFVLVKFTTKKTCQYYVGKVLKLIGEEEYEISFMRRHGNKFVFPVVEDTSSVLLQDIELHLPDPYSAGGTARINSTFTFPVDMSSYNVN